MKKAFVLSSFIFLVTTNVWGQNYFDFGNEASFFYAIRLELIDNETHSPISNATVTLFDRNGSYITRLKTDVYGVAIIFKSFYQKPGAIKGFMTTRRYVIKITSEEFMPHELEIDGGSLLRKKIENMIQFTELRFFSDNNWSSLNTIPSKQALATHISMRKFRIINGYRINYYWDAPAIYEHKIELRRVRENHHPDYRQNIERNRDRNNHTSKIFQRPSRNNYDVNRKRANTSLSNLSQREDSESVGITVTVSPYYSTLVWEDGFESYQGGAFPSATWTPDANASASYVDNTVSFEGTKSLRHIGALGVCWGALAYRPITVSPPYEIEFIVRNGNESLSGCHPDRAYIGIRKGFGWLNPSRSFITFTGDGSIISSSGASLRTYETLNWYRVRIRYERPSSSEVKVSYWIDDTFVGNETLQARAEEDQMTNIDLTLQEGTAWFDAVKVFQD